MDPAKGLFRRRPSTASTRSRLRPQAATMSSSGSGLGCNTAQSCPTSPKHLTGSRLSLGEQQIPEDEEAHLSPTTSSEAAAYAAAVTAAANQQRIQQPKENPQKSPTTTTTTITTTITTTTTITATTSSTSAQSKSSRVSGAGSRLMSAATSKVGSAISMVVAGGAGKTAGASSGAMERAASVGSSGAPPTEKNASKNAADKRTTTATTSSNNNGGTTVNSQLQRSASTISGIGVRPRSSPAGLHSYTGSVPSSVHGSRVDLSNTDKGSAIYLGCSAPRNSNWSLASSRGSSGGSAPPTPCNTPPVSPRHGVRRSVSLIKNKQR